MTLQIGIIAEGRADQFVLRNILYAFGLEKNEIRLLRPELNEDETDKTNSNENKFGSWSNVEKVCKDLTTFNDFLESSLAGEKQIIIQLDSDVCSEYDVQEFLNPKNAIDFTDFRQRIIDKINEWLDNKYTQNLFFAICIRQMDAWVLTLFAKQNDKDTAKISKPKTDLGFVKEYKKLASKPIPERYEELSGNFSKKKKLKEAIK